MTKKRPKEFHGYCKCDVCCTENIWCDSLKHSYKILHFERICEKCNKAISKESGLDSFGKKDEWQIVQAKATALSIHAKHLKAEHIYRLKCDNTYTIIGKILKALGFIK